MQTEVVKAFARKSEANAAYEYWSTWRVYAPSWGKIALMLCGQRSGQGASERMHQVVKRFRTKQSNSQSTLVTAAMSEYKMHIARDRFCKDEEARAVKGGATRVSVLGLVCEDMAERAMEAQKARESEAAASLLLMHNSGAHESFDDYGDDDGMVLQVDSEIQDAVEGDGDYGGIFDNDEDEMIESLLEVS